MRYTKALNLPTNKSQEFFLQFPLHPTRSSDQELVSVTSLLCRRFTEIDTINISIKCNFKYRILLVLVIRFTEINTMDISEKCNFKY